MRPKKHTEPRPEVNSLAVGVNAAVLGFAAQAGQSAAQPPILLTHSRSQFSIQRSFVSCAE
jgi:hypothetical protein